MLGGSALLASSMIVAASSSDASVSTKSMGSHPINELRSISLIKLISLSPTCSGQKIDHIYVCPFGILVIKTKNMSAWIFGGAPWFSLSRSKAGKARRQSPRPMRDELSPGCGRCVVAWGYFGAGLLVAGAGLLVAGVGLLVAGVGLLVAGVGLLVAGVGLFAGGLSECLVSRFC